MSLDLDLLLIMHIGTAYMDNLVHHTHSKYSYNIDNLQLFLPFPVVNGRNLELDTVASVYGYISTILTQHLSNILPITPSPCRIYTTHLVHIHTTQFLKGSETRLCLSKIKQIMPISELLLLFCHFCSSSRSSTQCHSKYRIK